MSVATSAAIANAPWHRLAQHAARGGKGDGGHSGSFRLLRLFTEHLGKTRAQKLTRLLRDAHAISFPPEVPLPAFSLSLHLFRKL